MSELAWVDVRRWNAGSVEESAVAVGKCVDELDRLADELAVTDSRAWEGEASYSEEKARKKLLQYYEDAANEGRAVKRNLHAAADAIEGLARPIGDAEALADLWHYDIGADGSVISRGLSYAEQHDPGYQETRRLKHQEIVFEIERVMRTAADIDADLAVVLRQAGGTVAHPGGDGQRSRLDPPSSKDPEDIHDWWMGLSDEERDELIETRAAWVGSADGIPVVDRDHANRIVLREQKSDLEAQIQQLRVAPVSPGRAGVGKRQALARQIGEIQTKLRGIEAIEKKLDDPAGTPENKRHYLLGVSTQNAGQAIVSVGNPDTADNTATYVPGLGSGLDGINTDMERGDMMQRAAARAGAENTAIVTWVGYDAPQGLFEAGEEKYAANAKDDLARFQDGLRATYESPQPSTNTLIGHSYGSVVVGHTMRDYGGADVDQAILVASPGTGVDHARDLHIGGENVFAVTDDKDVINYVHLPVIPDHGLSPVWDDYGATTFESDSGEWMASMEAHSAYWDPTNPSLQSMGNVIAGKTP